MYAPPKRRKLTKAERQEVYAKCGGHCAYCGCELDFKAMQVDHVQPLRDWNGSGGKDEKENMLPACRSCNSYKTGNPLESFREMVEAQPKVLARDSTTYRLAVRYELVVPTPHPVKFYFEKEGEQNDNESD